VQAKAVEICGRLWPDGGKPLRDRRDQRIVYLLAVLACHPQDSVSEWAHLLVDATVDAKPKRPLGLIQKIAKDQGVVLPHLLNRLHVPEWALEFVQAIFPPLPPAATNVRPPTQPVNAPDEVMPAPGFGRDLRAEMERRAAAIAGTWCPNGDHRQRE
jgi:hypothetical protein